VRALPGRRRAAWIATAGTAVVLAGLAACAVPVPGQRAGLLRAATVTPTAARTTPAAAGRGPASPAVAGTAPVAAAKGPPCPPMPPGGLKLNPTLPKPPPPPRGATNTHAPPELGCAYAVGYADVRKQNGAALVGPGLLNLSIGNTVLISVGKNYFQEDSAAQFDFRPCRTCRVEHALPPARVTLLAFGFVPVSATLQLTEIGTINIYGVGTLSALSSNTAWSRMSLRISDVTVDGKKLDVGAHCQTQRPVLIKLVGVSSGPHPYSLQGGGPLTGEITIPPFAGCGVTENLDPLFTGTVSGPGNFAEFTQGSLCTLIGDLGCPPPIPKPLR
jgi:hypothetical protein